MSRRVIFLAVLGVVIYLGALVVQLPAAWALHWARDAAPSKLQWHGVEGSVWQPRIRSLTMDLPGGNRLAMAPLEARAQVARVLTGHLGVEAEAGLLGGRTAGRAIIGLDGRWRAPRIQGDLRLEALKSVGPLLDFAQEGRLLFAAEGLAGARLPEAGRIRATLEDLRVGLVETPGPLGEYRLEAEITGPGRIEGRIRTIKAGVLGLKGTFHADLRAGKARFDGEGWATENAPEAVQGLLPLLGKVTGNRARIQWQGAFRGLR